MLRNAAGDQGRHELPHRRTRGLGRIGEAKPGVVDDSIFPGHTLLQAAANHFGLDREPAIAQPELQVEPAAASQRKLVLDPRTHGADIDQRNTKAADGCRHGIRKLDPLYTTFLVCHLKEPLPTTTRNMGN